MKMEEVQRLVADSGLDAFLFTSQANVFYLSRFRSTHAYVIVTSDAKYFLTDARYYHRAEDHLKSWEVVLIKGNPLKFIKRFLVELGVKYVGYEEDRVSCSFRKALRSTRIKWKGFSNFLRDVRVIKTLEEIDVLREGVRKSDEVFKELLNFVKEGMSELEIRRFIVNKIFEKGGTGESFPAIVASGEASAIPHWETSIQPVKKGPLLIDMGMIWRGYCTDFTRTLFLGEPDEDFKRIYAVVRDAHLFALEKVKEGNTIGDVDRTAREHIRRKGFGKYFTHSTGHGIGVEIHEYPRVYYRGEDAKRVIEEGMVFTVEPGVYIPDKFGVRIENMVVVKEGKGEPMSQVEIDLLTL